MAYVHYSIADPNTTITCVLTQQYIEVFIKSLPYSITVILCALNAILAVISTLLNLLILVAIISTPALHRPSFVLLCNLALTDFAVGITFGPTEITYLITRATGQYNRFCTIWKVLTITGYFLCSASMYTVTAISFDRYLSVSMSVKYRTIVTKKKTYYTVIMIWVSSAVGISTIGFLGNEAFLVLVCCLSMLNLVIIIDCNLLSFAAMKHRRAESRPISLAMKSKSESNLSDQKVSNPLSAMLKRLSDYDDSSSRFIFGAKAKEIEEENHEQKSSEESRNSHLVVLEVESENKSVPSKTNNILVNMGSKTNFEASKSEGKHDRRLDLFIKMGELEERLTSSKNKDNRSRHMDRLKHSDSLRKSTIYKPEVQSFKKSQHTILIIVVALFLCYLPFLFVSILISSHVINSGVSKNLAAVMVYANSSINAVIMCTRISGIRNSCWRIVRKILNRNKYRIDKE